MNANGPSESVDIAATRAMADGEASGAAQGVSARGVVHESQLRMSVSRAMLNVPTSSAGLGERIDYALQEDEALRSRVKTLLHESVGRQPATLHRSRITRALYRWAPACAATVILAAAVGLPMWISNLDAEPVFPISRELGSKLESSYADAERSTNKATFTVDAALDEATQLFGQRPMGIDLDQHHAELLWARQTRTPHGTNGYELGFGVYPAESSNPAERREVTLLIGRDDEQARSLMANARLYRILGSDLMVRGWRLQGLTYYMTAESKRALFHLQGAMRIPETIEASVDWPDAVNK